MRKGGKFPAWLERRSYFKRLGRWAKPKRRARAPRSDEATLPDPEAVSNILRFPEPAGGFRNAEVETVRRSGSL